MVVIADREMSQTELFAEFRDSFDREIITTLISSSQQYRYDSINQLRFELRLRKEIVNAARDLHRSGLEFDVFRKSRRNPAYWDRTSNGGFSLREGVKPSDAILDIYRNGSMYATECATAMMIVYYKALLGVYTESQFNKLFPEIELMNWNQIDRNLREVGMMSRRADYFPGDRRYFSNPDVDPMTPEWQGENVIQLGNGLYYGHGIGIQNATRIIQELNENRVYNADESARFLDSAARPDFKRLYGFSQRN